MSLLGKLDSVDTAEAHYLELADWLEVVSHSLDLDLGLSPETKSDLQEGLAHADAVLRRALAETRIPK